MFKDTICAIASGMVESGIGIIRISGSDAVEIASKVVKKKSGADLDIRESHRIKYGYVYDGKKSVDEVLVSTFIKPRSFTGEDTVEISCHGGVALMRRVLEICLRNGCRLAEPGEFTKRAFLNGRIDLSQAEAVGDLITAKNDKAIQAGMMQLKGAVSQKIEVYRASILEDLAFIEAALDDPEHISLDGFSETLDIHVKEILEGLEALIQSSDDGRILKEGIKTVILGKPNAGKSSLLNALMGEERAIVTDIAGTTRDTLEEDINISGLNINLIDTAGIRETDDYVEKIGVERALKIGDVADLIIYVVDGSRELDEEDERILGYIKDKKAIVLVNKSDLERKTFVEDISMRTDKEVLELSAKNGEGVGELKSSILRMFYKGSIRMNDEVIITSMRHKELLLHAKNALLEVKRSLDMGMPEDFYTIDLMHAYQELGYILGLEVSEDLVNEIFAKFCMGK